MLTFWKTKWNAMYPSRWSEWPISGYMVKIIKNHKFYSFGWSELSIVHALKWLSVVLDAQNNFQTPKKVPKYAILTTIWISQTSGNFLFCAQNHVFCSFWLLGPPKAILAWFLLLHQNNPLPPMAVRCSEWLLSTSKSSKISYSNHHLNI